MTRAVGGARSNRAETALRARPTLQDSRARDRAKKNATVAASKNSPSPIAPATATIIRRFMSGDNLRAADHALGATSQAPNTTASMNSPISTRGIDVSP